MKSLKLFFALLILTSQTSFAQLQNGSFCYGPSKSSSRIVILHGIDTQEVSPYWIELQKFAESFAKEHGTQVLLPRSDRSCPSFPGRVCWPQSTEEIVGKTLARIEEAMAFCFGGSKPEILVGHSNGGYFATRVQQYCPEHPFKMMLAIGSAGYRVDKKVLDGKKCGHLHVLIGANDQSASQATAFVQANQEAGYNTTLQVYPGGHGVPFDLLAQILRNQITIEGAVTSPSSSPSLK